MLPVQKSFILAILERKGWARRLTIRVVSHLALNRGL